MQRLPKVIPAQAGIQRVWRVEKPKRFGDASLRSGSAFVGTNSQASRSATLDMLTEALSCIVGESRQLGLVHGNDSDAVPRSFGRDDSLKLPLGYEQRNGVLFLVRPAGFEQPPCLEVGRLRIARRNECRAQDKTACRIHERDAVEIAVLLRANGRIVELEYNPRLVDLELTWF